ncbi:agmatinase [Myxococcota bacterium]|nr:agmatinase [Myxococcota bacterium]MBU1381801.1 agmatinase [Myxococcota bacterium]MBU1498578.1 agmatinase [Myxococcota bacterium]
MTYPRTVPYGFLGTGFSQGARVAVLPIPYDSTTSYRGGSREGPSAIIEASRNMETWDEYLDMDLSELPVITLEPLEPVMTGPEAMTEAIYQAAIHQLRQGHFLVSLGGEHSVTAGLARAHKEYFGDVSFLHFDAHADLRPDYEGTLYSHACAGSRMRELGPHNEVGIRSLSREEAAFVKENNCNIVWARDILKAKDDSWMEKALSGLTQNVYVTIDLDVFDPSIMPATGTPEPGGLLYHHVTDLLELLCSRHKVIGFDVNELAPIHGIVAPDFMSARLILRFLGLLVKNGRL